MNKITLNLPSQQRGSFYVTCVLLLLLGGALTVVLKLAPAYTGNSVVKNAMTAAKARSDYKDLSLEDLRRELLKSVSINGVEGFDSKSINFKHENGKDYVDISYEVRVPMVYNVSAIVSFQTRYDK